MNNFHSSLANTLITSNNDSNNDERSVDSLEVNIRDVLEDGIRGAMDNEDAVSQCIVHVKGILTVPYTLGLNDEEECIIFETNILSLITVLLTPFCSCLPPCR
jgi:hypothetical protein